MFLLRLLIVAFIVSYVIWFFYTRIMGKNLSLYNLNRAEKDGELKYLASVLDPEDNLLRDSLLSKGSRVLTFSGILKYNRFPLNNILKYFLESTKPRF